ncbi:MAG: pilus assembly protein TadG-related protein [Candidatus Limnocylindrales bacterium]
MQPRRTAGQGGQAFVLFALSLVVIILAIGLVIDGGNALVQRRASQNASDFAALAGARVVAEKISGDTVNGTDATVKAAIQNAVSVNGGSITFGAPNGPYYVASDGTSTGTYVGSGTIPATAVGVTVDSSRTWSPWFLGLAGITSWTAGADATANGGYAAGGPGGGVFPAGIAQAFFNGKSPCAGPVSTDPSSPCYPQHLTPGTLNVPGGFGWLKFGCSGYGLGQDPPANAGGCANSKPFLQSEIGPPPNSYGCCTQVKQPGSADLIGNLPGNKVSADCSYYIDNKITVYVPVWDTAGGTGQNAYYHIVGFTGFQITACDGGKDIEGVWRVPFFLGPTTTTPGFAGAALAVQLVR